MEMFWRSVQCIQRWDINYSLQLDTRRSLTNWQLRSNLIYRPLIIIDVLWEICQRKNWIFTSLFHSQFVELYFDAGKSGVDIRRLSIQDVLSVRWCVGGGGELLCSITYCNCFFFGEFIKEKYKPLMLWVDALKSVKPYTMKQSSICVICDGL